MVNIRIVYKDDQYDDFQLTFEEDRELSEFTYNTEKTHIIVKNNINYIFNKDDIKLVIHKDKIQRWGFKNHE